MYCNAGCSLLDHHGLQLSTVFFLNYLPVPCLQSKLAATLMQPSVDPRIVSFPPERALASTSSVYSMMGKQSTCSYSPAGGQSTPIVVRVSWTESVKHLSSSFVAKPRAGFASGQALHIQRVSYNRTSGMLSTVILAARLCQSDNRNGFIRNGPAAAIWRQAPSTSSVSDKQYAPTMRCTSRLFEAT